MEWRERQEEYLDKGRRNMERKAGGIWRERHEQYGEKGRRNMERKA